jgi:hypothetical protein
MPAKILAGAMKAFAPMGRPYAVQSGAKKSPMAAATAAGSSICR